MMCSRDLWLRALRMEPVARLPFWPKLNPAYALAHSSRFGSGTLADIHGFIGSDRHEYLPLCVREIRKTTSVEVVVEGELQRFVYRTPKGVATATKRFDRSSQSWHPIEFPIKELSDIAIMLEWYTDVDYEVDGRELAAALATKEAISDSASTATGIGESPLMFFVEFLAGVMNAHLLLADSRDVVEELFDKIHHALMRKVTLVSEINPADVLYLMENTSTTLISPEQYRRYCAPYITEYGRLLKDRNRVLVLHMCGHLKNLLPDLAILPAMAFEAFTSPPVGDTRLRDGRAICLDKCLIGGTNATLWLKGANVIVAEIKQELDALPHHRGIIVTSGGVMPPSCSPETIREVCEWVKCYPLRMGE